MLREMIFRYPAVPVVLIAILILAIAGAIFLPFLYALVIALAGAIILSPLHQYMIKRMNSGVATFILCILSLIAIIGFVASIFTALANCSTMLAKMCYTIYHSITSLSISENLEQMISIIPADSLNMPDSEELINGAIQAVISWVQGFALSLPSLSIQFLIFILALYLILQGGTEIFVRFSNSLPEKTKNYVNRLARITIDTVYAVFVVNIEIAVITFFITLPFFYFMGYENPVFWSFICGVSHLLPCFGPQLIAVFLGVYQLALHDYMQILLLIVIGYPLISGLADFYFRPKLLGDRVAVHPVLMMIGVFGGMYTLGAIGLIVGPLLVSLALTAYEIIMDALEHDDKWDDEIVED